MLLLVGRYMAPIKAVKRPLEDRKGWELGLVAELSSPVSKQSRQTDTTVHCLPGGDVTEMSAPWYVWGLER